jgi:hypothetical protein
MFSFLKIKDTERKDKRNRTINYVSVREKHQCLVVDSTTKAAWR